MRYIGALWNSIELDLRRRLLFHNWLRGFFRNRDLDRFLHWDQFLDWARLGFYRLTLLDNRWLADFNHLRQFDLAHFLDWARGHLADFNRWYLFL